ncbi:MAG: hypothetical protein JKY71_01380 [Alphaproteobacteria bacterium]|nr:hypothetical protein [Alphaproteobacteria bacterium]
MAVTDKDILASAKIFINQHGDRALIEAMKRIEEFEAKGDLQGRECWNQIAWAIEWMQMPQDMKDETCH